MRKIIIGIMIIFSMVLFTGCKGKSLKMGDFETNTLLVNQDGSVQGGFIEEFTKNYYSKEDLKEFAEAELSEYNNNGKNIKIDTLEVKNNMAHMIMTFPSMEVYMDFIGLDNYCMTLKEALDQKAEELPDTLSSVKGDGKKIKSDEIASSEDLRVLLVSEALDVVVNGKIKYYSSGAILNESKIQTKPPAGGYSVIIFK